MQEINEKIIDRLNNLPSGNYFRFEGQKLRELGLWNKSIQTIRITGSEESFGWDYFVNDIKVLQKGSIIISLDCLTLLAFYYTSPGLERLQYKIHL
jgi:hypothetical protein